MNNRGRQPVVVAGATGLIGRALVDRLRREGRDVIGVSRSATGSRDVQVDLTAPASAWPAWPAADVTYLCIGAGGLDTCEHDPAGTRRVHVDAVAALAQRAAAAGSHVVLVSTSHVFSGDAREARPDDPRTPHTVYGRQKAEAEDAVLGQSRAAVLRLAKVIGPQDRRLIGWRDALLNGESVEAFDDLHVAPIWLDDAVDALADIGNAGQSGIFQLSGPTEETYFSMAREVAAQVGARPSLVVRASAEIAGIPRPFRPIGVRLAPVLARPLQPAPLNVLIDRAIR